jgi:hypothetical protein
MAQCARRADRVSRQSNTGRPSENAPRLSLAGSASHKRRHSGRSRRASTASIDNAGAVVAISASHPPRLEDAIERAGHNGLDPNRRDFTQGEPYYPGRTRGQKGGCAEFFSCPSRFMGPNLKITRKKNLHVHPFAIRYLVLRGIYLPPNSRA